MYHIIVIVRGFLKKVKKDHVGAYAAQAAYYVALSFIPFIMLLLGVVQYIPLLNKADLTRVIINIVPDGFRGFIVTILDEVYTQSSTLVPVTALVAVWSAARGVLSLSNGFNVIYHVDETRNYVMMRIRAAGYTVLFILAILLSLILMVFGNAIQGALAVHLPLVAEFTGFLISLRTFIVLFFLIIVFTLIYKFVPNRRARLKSQLPGAAITAVAWSAFSFGFSIYVNHFNNMSRIYGSLTTIVLVMLWLYFCMYIVLMGAQVNAYFEERFRKVQDEISAWKAAKLDRSKE